MFRLKIILQMKVILIIIAILLWKTKLIINQQRLFQKFLKINDFYNKYKSQLDITRANVNIEARKVIACSNHQLCSSCGIKTPKIRTENILEKCLASEHRHITFTMPQDLTLWFINNL